MLKYVLIVSFSINKNVKKIKFCACKCDIWIPTYKHENRLELQIRFEDNARKFYSINNNFSFTQLINMTLEDWNIEHT